MLDIITTYTIGALFGVPSFRGYFLGVFLSLLTITIDRSLSSCGKENVCVMETFPPSVWIAFPASASSSLAGAPFIAIKDPLILLNGKHKIGRASCRERENI